MPYSCPPQEHGPSTTPGTKGGTRPEPRRWGPVGEWLRGVFAHLVILSLVMAFSSQPIRVSKTESSSVLGLELFPS